MKKIFLTIIMIFAGCSSALATTVDIQIVTDFIGNYLGERPVVSQNGSDFHVVACGHPEDITFLSETRGRMADELKNPDSTVSLDQVCPVQARQINAFLQFCKKNITATIQAEKPKMIMINFSGMAPVPEISGSVNTEPYVGTGMIAGEPMVKGEKGDSGTTTIIHRSPRVITQRRPRGRRNPNPGPRPRPNPGDAPSGHGGVDDIPAGHGGGDGSPPDGHGAVAPGGHGG